MIMGTIAMLFMLLLPLVAIPIIIIVIANATKKEQEQAAVNETASVKFCPNCGAEINISDTYFCVECGCKINQYQASNGEPDKPSVGLNILSFFFPLLGLIFYVAFNNSPIKAKSCSKYALIGFVIGLAIPILMFLVLMITSLATRVIIS